MRKEIYLDNAATTKPSSSVIEEIDDFLRYFFENPSSIYYGGARVKACIESARNEVAQVIGAKPEEIFFTSGGTESDNWALKGIVEAYKDKGKHIITSSIEHPAIINTCMFLESHGCEVTYLPVEEEGFISLNDLENAIRPDTILISIMYANNEIGTIEPITEIGKIAHKHDVLFHTDAVQAFGQIPINVVEQNIDLLSASSHKIKGLKGTGMLYIKDGVKMVPLIHGGKQEQGWRSGTENVIGIIGFGAASFLAIKSMSRRIKIETELRDYAINKLENEIADIKINGSRDNRLPNNINICIAGVEGESLVVSLDLKKISCSTASACNSGSLEPSRILLAIGVDRELAIGSLRLTIDETITKDDIDYVVNVLKKIVLRLRENK